MAKYIYKAPKHITGSSVTTKTHFGSTADMVVDHTSMTFDNNPTILDNQVVCKDDNGFSITFTDTDTFWNNTNSNYDEYATDAHFGSEKTYDYYYNIHGRNSIDGSGLKLVSYIHYSNNLLCHLNLN